MSSGCLKVLIVGSGFGCRIQVPAFRGAGFDVVGLVGTDLQRTTERARQNGLERAFTSMQEAITATGPHVVAVSTPPDTHAELTIAALELGCHVLCEKPFASSKDEAVLMLDAAERAGQIHFLGNEFRYVPQRAAIAQAIADGLIGQPRFATMVQYSGYVAAFQNDIPEWWFDPLRGGGWLGASGSHAVDQIRSTLGEFDSVSATLSRVTASRGPIEDSFTLRYTLRSGLEGVIQQSSGAFGPLGDFTRIAGDKGTIWTEGEVIHYADKRGERELEIPVALRLPPSPPLSGDSRHSRVEWQVMAAAEIGPYTELCRAFAAAIQGEPAQSSVQPATFHDGVANMAVLDAIRASAAGGGVVERVPR